MPNSPSRGEMSVGVKAPDGLWHLRYPLGNPPIPLAISTTSPLATGTQGTAYSASLAAIGGQPAYTFAVAASSANPLPPGLTLNQNTGAITGTPTVSETVVITFQVTDSVGTVAMKAIGIAINPPASGGALAFASPATLPNATNGGSYFYQMVPSGGTPPYKFAFNYPKSAAIASITGANPAVITINTVSATHPFAGLTQAYITGYGAQGKGTAGNFNSLTVSIVSLGGSSGQWTITTATDGTLYGAASSGTLQGGAIVGVTPAQLTPDGWLFAAPTVNETLSCSISCTDSAATPATVTGTFTIAVNSALAIMGNAAGASQPLPAATQGNKYRHQMTAAGGTGTGQVWGILSGSAPPGMSLSAAGLWTGTPTAAGTFTMVLKVVDSAGGAGATATFTIAVAANANVSRPSYNSSASNGFFVLGGKLYDPNGAPFFIRGLNRNHIDAGSQAAFALTQQNAMRCFLATKFIPEPTQQASINSQLLSIGQFPIVTRAADNAGNFTTGGTVVGLGNAGLGTIVSEWVGAFSIWSPIQASIAINIANEWGPTNSAVWRDAYAGVVGNISGISGSTITLNTVSATNPFANAVGLGIAYIKGAGGVADQLVTITGIGGVSGAWTVTMSGTITGFTGGGTLNGGAVGILRAVGYTCPFVIDSGGFGQDINDLVNFSAAVFATDPIKNIIFSLHFYGLGNSFPPGSTLANLNTIAADLVSLRNSTGAVYGIFEFGPATPPGASLPSPTVVVPGQVIAACEANAIPWCYWAFDDHNLATNQWTSAGFFGATLSSGVYAKASDLNYVGLDVIENPLYGVKALAAPASSFL
jgi:hypothetical protein